ncbi:hypothetical protein LO763_04225 [Glycomyces sp. A-F 0318]|uniref:hypothetical protein n=1 Tax=Glycomyces amatae TaxID=2881355 RepID=UPI001E5C57E6|nr:hypothetical protein [Glycomyces amatae]MCD0442830.1 hypothetical protein [Glycomyces amatae]
MTRLQRLQAWSTPARHDADTWFPGPLIGGAALVAGPALWFLGLLLRYLPAHSDLLTPERWADLRDRPFAAPMTLATYAASPGWVLTGFAVFMLGALVLALAYPALARVVAAASPRLGWWGASLVVLGLFSRLYWGGVEQAAFVMAEQAGAEAAADFALGSYATLSYGPWRIVVWCAALSYLGTLLLVVGAYRARVFGLARCAVLLWAGSMWVGALKESHLLDVLAAAAACAVLVPLGLRLLRGRALDGVGDAGRSAVRWWLPPGAPGLSRSSPVRAGSRRSPASPPAR